MIKLKGLSDEDISEISRVVADAFYEYEYNDEDEGLVKYLETKEDMFIYMNAIVNAAYNSGLLYATSENHEGFLMLSGEGVGKVKFFDGIKMIMAEKKALGSFTNMKNFINACFSDGGTIETRMNKLHKKYIKIEMLVVNKKYQHKGYMRKMLDYVYKMARGNGAAVILDTDDKDKCSRYEYLGMKLDRVRNCGDRFHMYDLIREVN